MTFLKAYCISVLLFYMIFYATRELLFDLIVKNGWIKREGEIKKPKSSKALFFLSMIPIFRIICLVAFIYMAMAKKD